VKLPEAEIDLGCTPGSTLPVSDPRTLLPVKTPAAHCCHDNRNQGKSIQGEEEPEVSLSAAVVSATIRLAFEILLIALQKFLFHSY